MALADYQQLVNDLVRDQAEVIDAPARDRAITSAVLQFGAEVPRQLTADVMWPADGYTGVPPAGWQEGMRVLSAQYPRGTPRAVGAIRTPDGWALQSVESLPNGALVALTYTGPHELTDTEDTIGIVHRTPVAMLAASLLCQQLATHYSSQRETAMGADVSQTETRAREFAARAREYRRAYYVGTGQADPFKAASGQGAGSGVASAAATGGWPARQRLGLAREWP